MPDKDFNINPLLNSPSFQPPKAAPSGLENFDRPEGYPFSTNTNPSKAKELSLEDALKVASTRKLPSINKDQFNTGKQDISQKQIDSYAGDAVTSAINWNDDYESIMRQTQSTWDRVGRTAAKFGANATSSFVTGLAVIPNIIGTAVNQISKLRGATEDVSSTFNMSPDSDFNKSIYQWKDEIEKGNRNYESNWAKDHWITNMIPFVGDGGAQDWMASSGYTVGAIAETLLTGGAGKILGIGSKLSGMGGKVAKYLNQTDKVEDVLSGIINSSKASRAAQGFAGDVGMFVGKAIEYSPTLYRAYVGAHSEAIFEALEGQQKLKEELMEQYRTTNGRDAIGEDYKKIIDIAQSAGDTRYGLNLALLTVPNYLQMGAMLKPFKPLNKFIDAIGGEQKIGKMVYDEKSWMTKVINQNGKIEFDTTKPFWNKGFGKGVKSVAESASDLVYRFPKFPLSLSEGAEEVGQGYLDALTTNLYTGAYLGKKSELEFNDYAKAAYDASSVLLTKESAKAFLAGAFSGGVQQIANTVYEAAKGQRNQIDALVLQNKGIANTMNTLFSADGGLQKAMQSYARGINVDSIRGSAGSKVQQAVRATAIQDAANLASGRNDRFNYENLKQQQVFDVLNSVLDSDQGTGDAVDVFNDHLDNLLKEPAQKVAEFYQLGENTDVVGFVNSTKSKLKELQKLKSKIDFMYPRLTPTQDNGELIHNYEAYKSELTHKLWTVNRLNERKNTLLSELGSSYKFYQNAVDVNSLIKSTKANISQLKTDAKIKAQSLSTPGLTPDGRKAIREEKEEAERRLEKQEDFYKRISEFDKKDTSKENYDKYLFYVRQAFANNFPQTTEQSPFEDVAENLQKAYDLGRIDLSVANLKQVYEALDKLDGFDNYIAQKQQYDASIQQLEQTLSDLIVKAQPSLYKVLEVIPEVKAILDKRLPLIEQVKDTDGKNQLKNELHKALDDYLTKSNPNNTVSKLIGKYKTDLIQYYDLDKANDPEAQAVLDKLRKDIFKKAEVPPVPTAPAQPAPSPTTDKLQEARDRIALNKKYVGKKNWIVIKIDGEKVSLQNADDGTQVVIFSKDELAGGVLTDILKEVDAFPAPVTPVEPVVPDFALINTSIPKTIDEQIRDLVLTEDNYNSWSNVKDKSDWEVFTNALEDVLKILDSADKSKYSRDNFHKYLTNMKIFAKSSIKNPVIELLLQKYNIKEEAEQLPTITVTQPPTPVAPVVTDAEKLQKAYEIIDETYLPAMEQLRTADPAHPDIAVMEQTRLETRHTVRYKYDPDYKQAVDTVLDKMKSLGIIEKDCN